ncbi:MAG: hypothetical protein ABH956_02845 [Candidatus Nealsonbacteria bacterium]
MAIQFVQKRKKQKYLIIVFGIVFLITAVVLWYGFLKKEEITTTNFLTPLREVKVDFDFLDSIIFSKLNEFDKISPFDEEAGRKNPFMPYGNGNLKNNSEVDNEINSEIDNEINSEINNEANSEINEP